jgi:hypothetical protein
MTEDEIETWLNEVLSTFVDFDQRVRIIHTIMGCFTLVPKPGTERAETHLGFRTCNCNDLKKIDDSCGCAALPIDWPKKIGPGYFLHIEPPESK